MFGLSPWMLVTVAILAAVSFGSGVWVRDAFCDSAAFRVQLNLAQGQIDKLNRNIAARDSAAKASSDQFIKDRDELARLQDAIDKFKATDGVCFLDSDVDGLRKQLWGK